MIKAVTVNGDGVPQMVVLGLSAENCFRLVEGMPIPVRLRELHSSLPDVTVLLVGGQTEEAIAAELRARMSGRGPGS